ncbi:MAG: class I SAM-dependent methyltransferase [Patescibacteria group bacterium]
MRPETVQKILEETKKNFDKIAEHFSKTREEPWEIMKLFLKYIKDNDRVLDIGCGNGRLYKLLQDKSVRYIGIDNSKNLIEIAKKNFQLPIFQVADALELPFKDEEFDAVFMIAVLPHIPSKELQAKVLANAYRVLKKNGYFFLTCWNLFQPKLFFNNLIQRFKNPKLYQDLGFKDFFVPWHLPSGEIIQRFYHAFTKKELRKLLKKSEFKIEKIYYEDKGKKSNWLKGSNLVVIARK